MGCLGAKNILGDGAPEGRTKSLTSRQLHQDDQNEQQTDDDMESKQDGQKQPHSGKGENCAIASGL
jgi:hypothetical protein